MISLYHIKTKWHLIVIISLVIQLIIILKSSKESISLDAESAIKRARTNSCKNELYEFELKNQQLNNFSIQLKRTCKLDRNETRNIYIGCLTNPIAGFLKLDHPVDNSSTCLDLCFSYSHSHATFDNLSSTCFCGNLESEVAIVPPEYCSDQNFDVYRVQNGIFLPNKSWRPKPGTYKPLDRPVKIAFLIITKGRGVMQIRRMVHRIYSESHIYYIHVDKRYDYLFDTLNSLYKNTQNIVVTLDRYRTIWGGTSLLRMLTKSFDNLSHLEWDYLINLSESDFPIKELSRLEEYLTTHNGAIFLRSHSIKGYEFIQKQGLDRNFYQCEDRLWRMGQRSLPKGIIYSGGSDWFAIPRDFCDYIQTNSREPSSLVKSLLNIYNYTLLPVESFLHTLALNSEFCDRFIDNNLRLTNWRRKQGCKCQHKDVVDWCGCSPSIYRSSDLRKLIQTNSSAGLFFARKFDPTVSSSIIGHVETNLLNIKSENSADTRHWVNIFTNNGSRDSVDYEKGIFLKNLADFLRSDVANQLNSKNKLMSIDLYFNQDKFVGLVFLFCSNELRVTSKCSQLLMEKSTGAPIARAKKCINSEVRELKVIEISHGFEAGEKMFRDYVPLNSRSEIAVYHEWLVKSTGNSTEGTPEKLSFHWHNPEGYTELVQMVTLKRPKKSSHLMLAHLLNIPKPIKPGVWSLSIRSKNQECLRYKFLVLGEEFFDQTPNIGHNLFKEFFKCTESCSIVTPSARSMSIKDPSDCSLQEWSDFSYSHMFLK